VAEWLIALVLKTSEPRGSVSSNLTVPVVTTIRIEAPHFTAAVDLTYNARREPPGRVVVKAAPILRYMLGWPESRVFDYCATKGWRAQVLS
jgi:hypothetical protein